MKTEDLTFSTFLRSPREVIDRLEYGDVILRRRGEPPLILTLEHRVQGRDNGTALVARMLAAAAQDADGRTVLMRTLRRMLAWMDLLPARAQDDFLDEFLRIAEAAADVGTYAPMSQLLRTWEETAAIYADPELLEQMTRPLPGAAGSVPEPPATTVS